MRKTAYIAAAIIVILLTLFLLAGRNPAIKHAEVKRGDITLIVAAIGSVEAAQEADLAPKSLGRIGEVRVKEGDFVDKDEVIAVLENEEMRAQVEQASANLLRAQVELKEAEQSLARSRTVFQKGIISQAELDIAQLKHDVALAQLKRTQADLKHVQALLDNTYIKAPFAGEITRKFVEPGETITLDKLRPIVTLSDVSKIIVKAEIDEADIRQIKIGQNSVVTSDAYPEEEFKGTVVQINPAVGKKKLTSDNPAEMIDRDVLEVEIELEPSGKKLNLGLQVDVTVFVQNKKDVLVLPKKAVEMLDGTSVVRIKNNRGFEKRAIVTGIHNNQEIEVLNGLEEGDFVALPDQNGSFGSNHDFPFNPFSR